MTKIVPLNIKRRIARVVPAWLWQKPLDPRFDGSIKDHESAIRADQSKVVEITPAKQHDAHHPMNHYVPDSAI